MIGEGWGAGEMHDAISARRTLGSARILAPLDVPEDLGVRVRTSGLSATGVSVVVRVNGVEAGRFVALPPWNEHEVYAPASLWRRELNDVQIEAEAPGVYVDQINFMRDPARP
jgi:hypothetical protein